MNKTHLLKIIKVVSFLVLVALGIFLVVFGEGDDSPGAQGLGLLMVVGGVVGILRVRH